jgi:hypothetical protein
MVKRSSRLEQDANAFQLFIKQYGRKSQKGVEPNDRRYDRSLQTRARHMRADELDALLQDGEDDIPG